ncbi:hypothetical protein ACFQY7_51510 [Actinomadura luteofluorescens]|uniref:hypothetical protein n=1 Tax=Actinomadura luteofluorescens TaxID=46163 RepID=UPI00362E2301
MSALFFARAAARQSLAGRPKYAAAKAAGAWRKSLLEKTAAGSPPPHAAASPTRAMMSRKSETSHSTTGTPAVVGGGAVGEERDVEAQARGGGQEPVRHRVGRLAGDQVERGGHDRPFQ